MTNVNITNFRKNVFGFIEQVVEFNDVVNVATKNGNAVILNEEDYNSLMETMYLISAGLRDSIREGMETSLSDCVPESEVEW